MFKHVLVQDAAYSTLLRDTRQQLHARIANVLEEQFPDSAEAQPELLAHHCTQAGLTAKAVDYEHKAGELAIRRSAMTEAVAHFTKALALLTRLPESAARQRREFRLQLEHAGALVRASGWASPQTGQAYSRACELSRVAEGISQLELISALSGLRQFRVNRSDLVAARDTAEEMQRIADGRHDKAARDVAHRALGNVLMFQGDFDRALAHLALALAHYDPAMNESPIFLGQANGRVATLSFTAWIRLIQGHFTDALARSREALDGARDLSNPYSLAFALHANCLFHQVAGHSGAVGERSALLVSLATEQGFPHLLATGTFFQGWAAFASGEIETGMVGMHQGLAAKQAGGAEIKVPYYLGLLANAYRQVGRPETSLSLLAEAFHRVERTDERWFEAELHRLKGEALITLGRPTDETGKPQAALCQALAVAQIQGAKLWELRASATLARLLYDRDCRAEARSLLTHICSRFEEGIDTPDLNAAHALLASLN